MEESSDYSLLDQEFMLQARDLAKQGQGLADPNPMVGAILVREGQVLGTGWHHRAGEPHAEVLALESASANTQGATLYVNLEPCTHTGRTGPCAPLLVQAGIRRVVVGLFDPDPRVSGQGLQFLREQGLEVCLAPLEMQTSCALLNYRFLIATQKKRACVTLKYAMSLDGKVATTHGRSKWITGEESRQHVHRQRHQHQAILVGRGTLQLDDPSLNVRGLSNARQPVRVILDSLGRSSPQARIFESAGGPILFYTTEQCGSQFGQQMRARLAEVVQLPSDRQGRVSLPHALVDLYERGLRSLLVEGGPQVHASFVEEGLADHVLAYIAPVFLGGHQAPGPIAGAGVTDPESGLRLNLARQVPLGEDLLWEGFPSIDWIPLRDPVSWCPV